MNYKKELVLGVGTVLAYSLCMKASDNIVLSIAVAFCLNLTGRLATINDASSQKKIGFILPLPQRETLHHPGLFGCSNGFILPQCEKNDRIYASLGSN